jgi:hypothetical protein
VPAVGLASTGLYHIHEADEGVANQLRLAVVVEDGDFDALVVDRIVHGEAELLVPR